MWAIAVIALAASCRRPPPPVPRAADQPAPATGGLWDAGTRRFAVVIGSNRGNAGRAPLRYAERDAARLAGALRELGSVAGSDTRLLLAPTAPAVRAALASVRALAREARAQVRGLRVLVLLYYSGHSDGRSLELGDDRLDFAELQRALVDTGADVRVTIVDACQSGSLLALKGGRPGASFDLSKVREVSSGEAILTSAAEDEEALESADLEGSYFSHHLLSGLRGAADVNHDGRVTLSEAYDYAASRTVAETTATLYGAQHPAYRLRLSGQGDLALTEIPLGRASVEIEGNLDRVLVIDAVAGSVAAEWSPGSARRLALTPGPYLIKAWQGRQILNGRLVVAVGQRRPVSLAMLTPAGVEPARPTPAPALAPAPARDEGGVTPAPPSVAAARKLIAGEGECHYRCVMDPTNVRTDCHGMVSFLATEVGRATLSIELPARRSLLRLRFEVCDPDGLWLNVGDSPSNDGGGGDDTQFSNDAELELRGSSLWLFGNDYARPVDKPVATLAERPGFVSSTGCSTRTLVLGDGWLWSNKPPLDVRSPHALRLDPARDDEGRPDRVWYVGLNRSIGSSAPARSGRGLNWLEVCVR